MNNKTIFDKYVNDIEKGTSREAMEMKKIILKMIKGEYAWAKTHQDERVCSKCGRVNSQAST